MESCEVVRAGVAEPKAMWNEEAPPVRQLVGLASRWSARLNLAK